MVGVVSDTEALTAAITALTSAVVGLVALWTRRLSRQIGPSNGTSISELLARHVIDDATRFDGIWRQLQNIDASLAKLVARVDEVAGK